MIVKVRIAQLVERNLAKVEVASSNLVSRSKKMGLSIKRLIFLSFFAEVVELVDTQDLKSCALWACGFDSHLWYKTLCELKITEGFVILSLKAICY